MDQERHLNGPPDAEDGDKEKLFCGTVGILFAAVSTKNGLMCLCAVMKEKRKVPSCARDFPLKKRSNNCK